MARPSSSKSRAFAERLRQVAEDYDYGRIHHDTHSHRNDETWRAVDAAGCRDAVLEILATTSVIAKVAATGDTLATIAKDYLGFPSLAERHTDHLDVREVHVTRVRRALEEAFRAGAAAARPGSR